MKKSFDNFADFFGELKSAFEALKPNRMIRQKRGLPSMGAPADYHLPTDSDLIRMIELARDYDQNDPLVGQMVSRAVDNILQQGFKADPATPNPELNTILKNEWNEWADTPELCDAAGEDNFHQLVWLSMRGMLVDCDSFQAYQADDQTYQINEAHTLRTPNRTKQNVVHGVKLDNRRKPLEYWFTKTDVNPFRSQIKVGDVIQTPVRDEDGFRVVNHLIDRKRKTQTRGWSVFMPIFYLMTLRDDLEFADLVHRQIMSAFIVFREQPEHAGDGGTGNMGANPGEGETVETQADGSQRIIKNIAPGMEVTGKPGETFKFSSPNLPTAEADSVKRCLQLISVNLGMPLAITLLDPSETNFSGWRGAVDQARLGWRKKQDLAEFRAYRPAYALRVWDAISRGGRAAQLAKGMTERDLYRVNFGRPKWKYIQPSQDATARKTQVASFQLSPQQAAAEAGDDWDEQSAQHIDNRGDLIKRAIEKAQQINEEQKPEPLVTWQDVLGVFS